jgi:hypothetical protein
MGTHERERELCGAYELPRHLGGGTLRKLSPGVLRLVAVSCKSGHCLEIGIEHDDAFVSRGIGDQGVQRSLRERTCRSRAGRCNGRRRRRSPRRASSPPPPAACVAATPACAAFARSAAVAKPEVPFGDAEADRLLKGEEAPPACRRPRTGRARRSNVRSLRPADSPRAVSTPDARPRPATASAPIGADLRVSCLRPSLPSLTREDTPDHSSCPFILAERRPSCVVSVTASRPSWPVPPDQRARFARRQTARCPVARSPARSRTARTSAMAPGRSASWRPAKVWTTRAERVRSPRPRVDLLVGEPERGRTFEYVDALDEPAVPVRDPTDARRNRGS